MSTTGRHPRVNVMVNLRIILAFLAGSLVLLGLLTKQGAGLVNEQAPAGIVSFELAGSLAKAEAIASAWESEGKTRTAIRNIRLDYLFIPFYSLLLYMCCGTLATGHPSRSQRTGLWIAFGCLVAGTLDVLENLIMTAGLSGGMSQTGALATALLASLKFLLAGTAVLYILFKGIRLVLGGNRNTGSRA